MNTKIYSIFFLLFFSFVFSQNVVFNDPNFKQLFLNPYNDLNSDGEISYSEALTITTIWKSANSNISDLTGIEKMTNLTTLLIKNNPLSQPIDLSFNINLKTLNLQASTNVLNVTGTNSLEQVILQGPFSVLDFSNKPALTNLSIQGIAPQTLQSLNVTGSPALLKLWCTFCGLSSIDVTQNPVLEELVLGVNNSFTTLNVTQNPLLKMLSVGETPLGTIDVTQNPILESLMVEETGLTSINLQNNPLLKLLAVGKNDLSNGISLSNLTVLESLYADMSQLTSLDLSNNVLLQYLSIGNNFLTHIDVTQLSQLKRFTAHNNLFASVDLSQNSNLTNVSFTSNSILKYINVKNGNNVNMNHHNIEYAFLPQLLGVCVDDPMSIYGLKVKGSLPSSVLVTSNCSLLNTQESLTDSARLSFYPNPVGDWLNIDSKENLLRYEIFENSGRLIKNGKFAKGEKKIFVGNLSAGNYIVTASTSKSLLKGKVIKK